MARLSDHNSGHERIQVLFDAGSGERRLHYMLRVLELLLSVDYLLLQLQKQNLKQMKSLAELWYTSEDSF